MNQAGVDLKQAIKQATTLRALGKGWDSVRRISGARKEIIGYG
jgi:hypothetical protein